MREWTISELSARLQAGEVTSEALIVESIQRAKATPLQSAYVFLDAEGALASARASDERRKKGITIGALDGIPFAVEDRFCVRNMPTENGCRMLEGYRPLRDAEIVNRLRAEGAILLGKLVTDGFLAGSAPTKHIDAIAKAVETGEIPFVICADTGSSAFCERAASVIVSRYSGQLLDRSGLFSVAPSFDGIAAMTQNTEDARRLFDALINPVNMQIQSNEIDTPKVKDFDLSRFSLEKAKKSYRILSVVETASEMALYDGIRFGASADNGQSIEERMSKTRGEFLSYDEKKNILLGTALLMDGRREDCYFPARAHREEVRRKVGLLLEHTDVIRLPLSEETAFLPSYLGLSALASDGVLLMTDGERNRLLFDAIGSGEGGGLHA